MPYKDPEKRKTRQRERRREKNGMGGGGCPETPGGGGGSPALAPVPLATPGDAVTVLAEQINLVRADGTVDVQVKARTCGYLASVLLKAIEVADLAERLKAVEARMGNRS